MAKRKKITKTSKRRLMLFGSISLFIILYFIIVSVSNIVKINQLNDKYNTLEGELLELQETEENLKNEITKLQDPDYLARYAREHYSYSKDGEYVLRIESDDTSEPDLNNAKSNIYVYSFITGFVALIIMIIVIKKNKLSK